MIRKVIAFALALGATTVTASAADLRMPLKAPPPVAAAVYNWTGFYIGVNGGYSWGRASNDGTLSATQNVSIFRTAGPSLVSSVNTLLGPFPFTLARTDVNGFIGGGQVGYNWQTGMWVLGIETDIQGSAERGSTTACSVAGCPAGSAFLSVSNELRWLGTLRGRAGILATDRVLFYGTGGLAYGQLNTSYTTGISGIGTVTPLSATNTRVGWTAGVGVEGALDPHWTVRLEYLYVDLGSVGNAAGSATFATNQLNTPTLDFNTVTTTTLNGTLSTRFTDNILRAAVNYRF
jgi:outer membrane immunogenic protein